MGCSNARYLFALIIIIVIFILLAERQIQNNSVTADEYVHLPVGYSHLKTADFKLDHRGNPPLLRQWIALPLVTEKPLMRFDERWRSGDFYGVAWEFMVDNAKDYHRLFSLARTQILILSLIFAIMIFLFAVRVYGVTGGFITLCLFCFSANIIAHSSLATLDAGLAFFTFASQLCFFYLCGKPNLKWSILCGIFTGCAMLSKYTGITIIAFQITCLLIVAIVRSVGKNKLSFSDIAPMKRVIPFYLVSVAVAVIIINADYGFQGMFIHLREFPFQSDLFKKTAGAAGWIRLPLPQHYILGFDSQQFASGKIHTYYLMGKLSKDGWWYYFIVAYLVKESIPAIVFFALSILSIIRMRLKTIETFFLVPAIGVFLFYSFIAKVDLGIRYLAPALPFMYFFCGRIATVDLVKAKRFVLSFAAVLLVWHAAGTIRVSPYLLAYFNEGVGGAMGGYRYVLESNYDWGQNLIALKKHMDKNRIDRIMLYNYGLVSPQIYGIHSGWAPCGPVKGRIAISPNYVYGIDPFQRRQDCFKWLRGRKPVSRAGFSLFIYDIY
ncbi:MAG: phospholipid carrier-dependent glycosyltransferase [bacterium]